MSRFCKGVCDHIPHIKSLRWVGHHKYEYKYCCQCGVYFRTEKFVCECCKNPLRVTYRSSRNGELKRLREYNRAYRAKSINSVKLVN